MLIYFVFNLLYFFIFFGSIFTIFALPGLAGTGPALPGRPWLKAGVFVMGPRSTKINFFMKNVRNAIKNANLSSFWSYGHKFVYFANINVRPLLNFITRGF